MTINGKQYSAQKLIERYGMTDEEAHYIPDTLCQTCGNSYPLPGSRYCEKCQKAGERHAD